MIGYNAPNRYLGIRLAVRLRKLGATHTRGPAAAGRLPFPLPHDDVHRCYILWKGLHPRELSCVIRQCVAPGLESSLGCDPLHKISPCGAIQAGCTAWSGRAEDARHGCLLGGGSCGGAARLMPLTEEP